MRLKRLYRACSRSSNKPKWRCREPRAAAPPFKNEYGSEHEQNIGGAGGFRSSLGGGLARVDPEIFAAIEEEEKRQRENIELIASENFTSRAVMEAQGSCLTNKYAEGYPGKRWYGGCENVDVVEQLAIDRAHQLFGAEHVNVQPHSGAQANMAVYFAAIKPGDKILDHEPRPRRAPHARTSG